MADFVADFVTNFCIFLSYKLVGKSFGVTYAPSCIGGETALPALINQVLPSPSVLQLYNLQFWGYIQ